MVLRRIFILALVLAAATTLMSKEDHSAFSFQKTDYFHRWSQGTQHEFTPAKQEDLDHWADMITINVYPDVDDGEKLAGSANAVLENYRSHQGKILKTSSVPATDEKPAEHFIVVRFNQPDFVEVAFARFKLVEDKGHSFVYSHRVYGDKAIEEMNAWITANGEKTEHALLDWNPPADATSRR
ncbi:MAG TPA: hypothetical protein VH188_12575 [Chthoniobacterales bacterium]|jgi:hypothetical protein|nr:hypothetical protein [Chthoniobacterales bacterium]